MVLNPRSPKTVSVNETSQVTVWEGEVSAQSSSGRTGLHIPLASPLAGWTVASIRDAKEPKRLEGRLTILEADLDWGANR